MLMRVGLTAGIATIGSNHGIRADGIAGVATATGTIRPTTIIIQGDTYLIAVTMTTPLDTTMFIPADIGTDTIRPVGPMPK